MKRQGRPARARSRATVKPIKERGVAYVQVARDLGVYELQLIWVNGFEADQQQAPATQ